jgi:hypothetical protein
VPGIFHAESSGEFWDLILSLGLGREEEAGFIYKSNIIILSYA